MVDPSAPHDKFRELPVKGTQGWSIKHSNNRIREAAKEFFSSFFNGRVIKKEGRCRAIKKKKNIKKITFFRQTRGK